MIKIFLLIWFLVPVGGGDNIMTIDRFTSSEACKKVGDLMAQESQMAQDAKQITTYGGMCYEVPESNNGSI